MSKKKKIILGVTIGMIILVMLIIIFYLILFVTNIAVKLYPMSNRARLLSGYSDEIKSTSNVESFKLDDGSMLVIRKYKDFLPAGGFKSFPDGGVFYYMLDKIDLLKIKENGEILWQNVYIKEAKNNYDINKSQIGNSVLYKLSEHQEVEILFNHAQSSRVYKCSDWKYQISPIFAKTAIEIDGNKVRELVKPFDVCPQEITNLTENFVPCEKLAKKNQGNSQANMYSYNSYCVKPLLDKISNQSSYEL